MRYYFLFSDLLTSFGHKAIIRATFFVCIYLCISTLSKLGKMPEAALLCTVDVVGLYPSIQHGEGLEAIREALDRRENPGVVLIC